MNYEDDAFRVLENVKNGNLLCRISAIPKFNEIQSAADSNNHPINLFNSILLCYRLIVVFMFFSLTILLISNIINYVVFHNENLLSVKSYTRAFTK